MEETTRAMAKNVGERFGDIFFYAVVLLLAYLVYRVFKPFLVPLAWAGIFATILYSWNKRLEERWGRTFSALLTTAGVMLVLIVPALFLMTLFVREGIEATRSVQASVAAGEYGWFNRAWAWVASHVAAQSAVDLPSLVRQAAGRLGTYLASELGAVVRNMVVSVFELFVMLFALFYFLRDGAAILDRIRHLLPFEEAMREEILVQTRDLIFASIVSSLFIAAIQGVICGGAFAIVGVGSAVFWGVAMAFLSLLPMVGAWPIWIPAAIWLFSTVFVAGWVPRSTIFCGLCF
jgi:predicted PurR-regulated permease PerM